MYLGSDAANFAVLLARVWVGIMIFAHGWRHVKAIRSGPGMANWFESLGLKPGHLHAWTVTLTEVFIPVVLVLGFLTPLDYGGVCALMLVALVTNHLQERLLPEQREGGLRVRRQHRGAVDHAGHARAGQVVARPRLRHLASRSTRRRRSSPPRSSASVAPRCSCSRSGGHPRRTTPPPERGRGEGGAARWVGSRSTRSPSGSTTSPPSTT